MAECAQLGIRRVWKHRSTSAGSVPGSANESGRKQAITVGNVENGDAMMR